MGQKIERILSEPSGSSWDSAIATSSCPRCRGAVLPSMVQGAGHCPCVLSLGSPPTNILSNGTIYLKYSSYEFHPTISISWHSLRLVSHPESGPGTIWKKTITHGHGTLPCILLTFPSVQRQKDNHSTDIGGDLMLSRVKMEESTLWWYRQFSPSANICTCE